MEDSTEKYNIDDIRVITKEELFRKILFDKVEIDWIYVIIGFLEEYMGGYREDQEFVDGFFVNEQEKAKIFKGICEAYLDSIGEKSDIKFSQSEEGFSWVCSNIICSKLADHYQKEEEDDRYMNIRKDDALFMNPDEVKTKFGGHFNFYQYSFLLGVFIRNEMLVANNRVVVFANAVHKAQMTIDFLKNFIGFGIQGSDHLAVKYYFNLPHSTHIILSNENPFWKEVDRLIDRVGW